MDNRYGTSVFNRSQSASGVGHSLWHVARLFSLGNLDQYLLLGEYFYDKMTHLTSNQVLFQITLTCAGESTYAGRTVIYT